MLKNFHLSWKDMKNPQFEEAFRLLKERFEKNDLPFSLIEDKTILDLGCGSGRYTYALKKLGAKRVVGVDIDIEFAKETLKDYDIEFHKSSVDKIPTEDSTFDFVFCNGVLHHTNNLVYQGISEISRVLKPNGLAWIYLYGTESKYWEYCDEIRERLKSFPVEKFDRILQDNLPADKKFTLLDLFYSPRLYYSKEEYIKMFNENNLGLVRILERGSNKDFPELIYNNPKLKGFYGDGELRFIVKKLSV